MVNHEDLNPRYFRDEAKLIHKAGIGRELAIMAGLPALKHLRKIANVGECYGCGNPMEFSNEAGDWCHPCWDELVEERKILDEQEDGENFWKPEVNADHDPSDYPFDMEGDTIGSDLNPSPMRFSSKKKAAEPVTQENMPDTTKLLGVPGVDPDSMNYFDHRELARKFYSQLFESAVMICDDATMYQVLQLLNLSGNFVIMLQDVLHPQIVFTVNANDLMTHIWKWIAPYDVIVNPDKAPMQAQSISDIVSVGDLEKPVVPERWLSY